jgi:hypothetical protein
MGHLKPATHDEMERVREVCYVRQLPNIISKKNGWPLEYDIPKSMALYILNRSDKAERLAASSPSRPTAVLEQRAAEAVDFSASLARESPE